MTSEVKALADRLESERGLSEAGYAALIDGFDPEAAGYLAQKAMAARRAVYGDGVFIRGLIEISSYCKNDCLYCGIRRGNSRAERYRLTQDDILSCCETGYALGFRTFVLQGGEDPWYTGGRVAEIVRAIKARWPDCAVTLSLGEQSRSTYQAWFDAGADRYLLRHETADDGHYRRLHPPELLLQNRMRCLRDLREIGYQTGCGFMVGSPYQTTACLARDLRFIQEFRPHMVGIGPFIPHRDTPFAAFAAGSADLTAYLLSVIRIMLPQVLLPATTALNTIDPRGRQKGLLAGANVVMPNLSPSDVRKKYLLYDNKRSTGAEGAESLRELERELESVGCRVSVARGDSRLQ